MAVSLTWSVSVSNTSDTAATVKVTLKAKSTYGSYNADKCSGWIKIDGTKYTFSHAFSANTTTTLTTKSKSISRTTSSKRVSISASYATDISSGTVTKSGSATVPARPKYAVTFNGNGGTSSSASVYSGYTTTFPSSTREGYTLANWGASSYTAGATTPAITSARTYTAVWAPNQYDVTFNANGGTSGSAVTLPRTYNAIMEIDSSVTPTRGGYAFIGWAESATATTAQYTTTYPASTSTDSLTLYAVWAASFTPPAFDLAKTVASRHDTETGQATQDGRAVKIEATWTNGKDASGATLKLSSVTYEYKESTAAAWTTLGTKTISSASTTSDTYTTGTVFATDKSYDIRITLTDSNASVTYTTFVSKASYIWRVPSGGRSLELGVDLAINDNKNIILTIDDSAGSGTDYDIKTALTALGWDVTAE